MASTGRHRDGDNAAGPRVRAYFAALAPAARRRLAKVRTTIRGAEPRARESFGYGIPGFMLDGKTLLWYAAWKNHLSLYPLTATLKRQYADELRGYETGKGTLRLPMDEPVPTTLLRRLVKARAAELRAKRKA